MLKQRSLKVLQLFLALIILCVASACAMACGLPEWAIGKADDPEIQLRLGHAYYMGEDGVEEDEDKAFQWF